MAHERAAREKDDALNQDVTFSLRLLTKCRSCKVYESACIDNGSQLHAPRTFRRSGVPVAAMLVPQPPGSKGAQ